MESLVALVLSWIFVGYLIGGLLIWWILTVGLAHLIYNNNGHRAVNTAAWVSFVLVALLAGSVGYFWLGERWIDIALLTAGACILPFLMTIWLTASE